MSFLKTLLRDESGATAIEYALIAGLISVVAIGAMSAAGDSVSSLFNSVKNALDTAVAKGGTAG